MFSQSLFTLTLIEEFLQRKKLTPAETPWRLGETYYRLDGSTSALEREKLINSFNSNTQVKLFLVSTRAGSLGVNLVGANRVVIFDASWNPCHDTQAVCRVYRYGQKKSTHVYRLVTDNSLEKKIYDRQVNKQGMADRIVDELNPDAHLSSREVHTLISDEGEDPPALSLDPNQLDSFMDPVMRGVVSRHQAKLTRTPFSHESLLVDRKDSRLSKAEKKLAERSYSLERTSKITYSRPSYAAFYPKAGGSGGARPPKRGTWGSTCPPPTGPLCSPRPVASVRPRVNSDQYVDASFPSPSFTNVLDAPPPGSRPPPSKGEWTPRGPGDPIRGPHPSLCHPAGDSSDSQQTNPNMTTTSALEALKQQGVGLQQVVVPRDLVIPTGHDSPSVSLTAGQSVMVIKTPKGIYLRLNEKIIKIKQPAAVQGLLGGPVPGGHNQPEDWGGIATASSS